MIEKNDFLSKLDYQTALEKLIQPLRASLIQTTKAGIKVGGSGSVYDQRHAEMEAFIRPLWGLAPYWTEKKEDDLRDSYVANLIKGTDPASENYWGEIEDYDQYIVEMAALALTLLLHQEYVWSELTRAEQQNVIKWMKQALEHKIPKNNWTFFKVLIQVALYYCGEALDRELLLSHLKLIDGMYLADGWYFDGKKTQKDYYIPFAFHFYGLIVAVFLKEEEPSWSQKFIERATLFAQTFIYYFDADGEAVPYGRSATYRFAQGSFFSALVFAEVEAIPWGQMKMLLSNHMKNWFAKDIFTFDGRLSIGYHYENLVIAEGYNAPGSPYWALKIFLLLATKNSHPFWQAEPEPITKKPKMLTKEGNMLLIQAKSGQHVLGFPAGLMIEGQAHAEAKYSKFVYSTKFGFSVPKAGVSYEEGAFDNVLAVSRDGQYFRPKRNVRDYFMSEEKIVYNWAPFENVQIETTIFPLGEWHVRIHEITTAVSLDLREGGFSLPLINRKANATVTDRTVKIKSDRLTSTMVAIEGYAQAEIVQPEANTSLFFPRTSLPYLSQKIMPGTHRLICLVGGCYEEETIHDKD